MKKKNEVSLKDVVQKMMKAYQLDHKLYEQKIQTKWPQLMGKMIANHTRSIQLKEDKLILRLDSAPLKQELTYSKEKLKEILNNELGKEVIRKINIW